MSEIKKKLMVFAKLGTLFVYCSPAILALIIFVFKSYKEKLKK